MSTVGEHIRRAISLFWHPDLLTRPFYIKLPVSLLRLIVAVGRDLKDGGLKLRATSLVYTTLLSLAPLLAISFSVMKGFGVHNQVEPLLINLLAPLGEQGMEIAQRIVEFVANIKVGVLGAVGFTFLLYTVMTLMNEIEKAMNEIWRVRQKRRFASRLRDHLSILLIGPFLMFLSMTITASLRHTELLEKWFGAALIENTITFIGVLTAWGLFAVAFAALYMFMPNTRVRLGPALTAGAITGVMWKLLGWLFSVFVAGSANYAAVYSAFAALVLFMIWLYIGWLVVLIGASICFYLQNPSNQSLSRKVKSLSLRVKEKIALEICVAVGKAFYKNEPPPDLYTLSRHMMVPVASVEDISEELIKAGLLMPTTTYPPGFIPGCPFDDITVDEMLKSLRAADEERTLSFDHINVSKSVENILQAQEKSMQNAFGKMTLKKVSL